MSQLNDNKHKNIYKPVNDTIKAKITGISIESVSDFAIIHVYLL